MARKPKSWPYGFGGHSIAKLEERIAKCKAKLADADDSDDKRWLAKWLQAAERRLAMKERSLEARSKQSDRQLGKHLSAKSAVKFSGDGIRQKPCVLLAASAIFAPWRS